MEMKILLRNIVEQEIEVNSTTELKRKLVFPVAVLNEGTPENQQNLKFVLIYLVLSYFIKYNSLIFAD